MRHQSSGVLNSCGRGGRVGRGSSEADNRTPSAPRLDQQQLHVDVLACPPWPTSLLVLPGVAILAAIGRDGKNNLIRRQKKSRQLATPTAEMWADSAAFRALTLRAATAARTLEY